MNWLQKVSAGKRLPIPATNQSIELAKQFVLEKWKERSRELGRDDPLDLSDACKFASLFAQQIFGGEIMGNWEHQCSLLNGQMIDLTGSLGLNLEHDEEFWMNPEHAESIESCMPRVQRWVKEFLERY